MPSVSPDQIDVEKNDITQIEYGPGSGDPVTYQRYPTKIANPGPTGVLSFAATTFILSMYNANVRGIEHPNVIVGMSLFAGGLTQFMAAMWEFPRGNVFGATVFASYASFWMSYATILIPASGIMAAYPDEAELGNALGIYLITWMMITFFFLLAVIKKNVAFSLLLADFTVMLAVLSAGEFTGMRGLQKAGGALGIIGGLIAFYIGVSELLAAESTALMRLPLGNYDRAPAHRKQ